MDQACSSLHSLEPLFPPGYALDGDEQTGLLSLLASRGGRPHLVAQERLTRSEWRVLMALIDVYPGYAPYALLLALITPCSQHIHQKRLQDARVHGNDTIKQVLRPLRKVLASLHPKLRHVGLMVASVQGLGYLLAADEVALG